MRIRDYVKPSASTPVTLNSTLNTFSNPSINTKLDISNCNCVTLLEVGKVRLEDWTIEVSLYETNYVNVSSKQYYYCLRVSFAKHCRHKSVV